jgi:hypothetical protein
MASHIGTERSDVELKVGDMVQTTGGLKGTIVVLTKDGSSAYVLAISNENCSRTYTYWLDELTKIEESE